MVCGGGAALRAAPSPPLPPPHISTPVSSLEKEREPVSGERSRGQGRWHREHVPVRLTASHLPVGDATRQYA